MKLSLFCNSVEVDEDEKNPGGSRVRNWYDSLRKCFVNNKSRVKISDPIPMSKDEAAQVSGVVVVEPPIDPEVSPTDNAADSTSDQGCLQQQESIQIDTVDGRREPQLPQPLETNEPGKFEEPEKLLIDYGWFWGNITRRDAENLLRHQEEGSFLVRQSSDKRFLYSLSFRSNGKTMHTRIEYSNGLYSFYSNDAKHESEGSGTLAELIREAISQNNADNIFFYSRGLKSEASLHTVSLIKPLSRYHYLLSYLYQDKEHKCLQYLCKFVLRHPTRKSSEISENQHHSLPKELQSFLNDNTFFPLAKAI